VDSFDFTGLCATPAGSVTSTRWHYTRPNFGVGAWRFVYPNVYSAFQSLNPTAPYTPQNDAPRLVGVDYSTFPTLTTELNDGSENMGLPDAAGSLDPRARAVNPFRGIQLANQNWAGYNNILVTPPPLPTFPFGAFAR